MGSTFVKCNVQRPDLSVAKTVSNRRYAFLLLCKKFGIYLSFGWYPIKTFYLETNYVPMEDSHKLQVRSLVHFLQTQFSAQLRVISPHGFIYRLSVTCFLRNFQADIGLNTTNP